MSGLLRFFQRIVGSPVRGRTLGPDLTQFAEGDRVLVDGTRLTGPLKQNERHNVKDGYIAHKDIIGRPSMRQQVAANTGAKYEVSYPSFDDYVSLAPRKVTPIYANYSSLMVSLLDIHVAAPTTTNEPSPSQPPLEILESGTGHGSLTLHLSRAIAAANPPSPPLSGEEQEWTRWKTTRRAILHSVEINEKTSAHAQKLIKGFRQGLYYPHVNFYVSDVASWVTSLERTQFLSHVLLDMPGVHHALEQVVPAMKDDAVLMAFVPSITQVGDCVRAITEKSLPLKMSQVVEMGEGMSNGRYWDVRLVQKRSQHKREKVVAAEARKVDPEKVGRLSKKFVPERLGHEADEPVAEAPVMVCRPLVGRATRGACYVALWRKLPSLGNA